MGAFEKTNDIRTYTAIASTILNLFILEQYSDSPKLLQFALVGFNVFMTELVINHFSIVKEEQTENPYDLILFQ